MATLVIWHGYLLGGTGSNIYSASIIEAWVKTGHDVVLMCQDPTPDQHASIHAFERVDGETVVERRDLVEGGVEGRHARGLGTCTMVQADIAGLLPVYLLDRYPGFEVKRFVDLDQAELDRYAERYAAAMQGVIDRYRPAGVLLNHVVMGPPAMRDVMDVNGVPYVVKVHGSELEYCIAQDDRFIAPAQYGLVGARAILSGSAHITRRTAELLGEECLGERVQVVPPGVDLDLFQPALAPARRTEVHEQLLGVLRTREAGSAGRAAAHAAAAEQALAGPASGVVERLRALHDTYNERDPEPGAATELAGVDPNDHARPLVAFVGKMIHQKGTQLLVAAMPLVVQAVPGVHFAMVGFGQLREGVEALVAAIERGNRHLLDELVAHVTTLDGGADAPLDFLPAYFGSLEEAGELDGYLAAATDLRSRVTFTGQVNHEVLASLWPLCRTSIVPSIAAEAFGMVSAEAASCGCPPVVAHHSGLADVADALEAGYPGWAAGLASFSLDAPDPVRELADRIIRVCQLPHEQHVELANAARSVVEQEWSWFAIAASIADLMSGVPAE